MAVKPAWIYLSAGARTFGLRHRLSTSVRYRQVLSPRNVRVCAHSPLRGFCPGEAPRLSDEPGRVSTGQQVVPSRVSFTNLDIPSYRWGTIHDLWIDLSSRETLSLTLIKSLASSPECGIVDSEGSMDSPSMDPAPAQHRPRHGVIPKRRLMSTVGKFRCELDGQRV